MNALATLEAGLVLGLYVALAGIGGFCGRLRSSVRPRFSGLGRDCLRAAH